MRIRFRISYELFRPFYYRSLTTRAIVTKTPTMAPPTTKTNNDKQPLKILMLHGYTQSGPAFHAKTRALVKHIQKVFPLHDVHTVYPTGPIRLDPSDIPGYEPPTGDQEGGTQQQEQEIEAYGWWRRSNTADPPEYLGLEDGLSAVATTLREEGPFDGIIGFSQGAALAAMVASLLESGRKESFVHFSDPKIASAGFDSSRVPSAGPVSNIPFPSSFEESSLGFPHGPLKFVLCYSGFRSPGPRYRAFYENPAIQTPLLHVLGTLDAVVDDSRSRALIDACVGDPEKEGKVVWHPGGHFLPSQRPFLDAAVKFIKEQLEKKVENTKEDDEEDVNNMDVPF